MAKITNFQLYCMLVLLTLPVAILEQPHRLINIAYNNAWLTIIPVIFSGALLVLMYSQIINKSKQAFPLLLDEHLGKFLGRILGSIYILIFFLISGFTLRVFIEYMKTNILPLTPISVFSGVILLAGIMAIKIGIESIARSSEIIVIIGLFFTFLIVIFSITSNSHFDRMLPIAYMDYKTFGKGFFIATFILGKMMPVLCLAFFLPKKETARTIMNKVLVTYVPLLTLTTLAVIVTVGSAPSLTFVFPTVNMIRLARIGDFIHNIDIVFMTIWIMGIFGAVTLPWFMACFTIQKVFNLQDYRFLAAPSSIIIGILSIIISQNNLEVIIWSLSIIPYIISIFFILIPFIIFIISLFKVASDIPAPEPANPPDPLNKQAIPG